ncbi:hypothetical protein A4A49_40882 [Nicotiana attenuata]|uniref:Uncharacterized protein n=1 Tax=Nicotiana attenuata TaxID=49451 RepID=A0A1J6K8N9_NICAT|nr:hypothetical protein A4A49_40882 [Nicotiana attenuata]
MLRDTMKAIIIVNGRFVKCSYIIKIQLVTPVKPKGENITVLDAPTPNGDRAQSSTEQATNLKDPKATYGSKTTALNRVSQVCDGVKQVSKDPTVDHVSDQGCTQVCRGNEAVQQLNNGQGQINILTDATVARAELVEKPAGFKSIVVHDESQDLNVLMFWIV